MPFLTQYSSATVLGSSWWCNPCHSSGHAIVPLEFVLVLLYESHYFGGKVSPFASPDEGLLVTHCPSPGQRSRSRIVTRYIALYQSV